MDELNSKFYELFGKRGKPQKFFCPGRINLIGEHIDYLGGHVLPCAISMGITCLAAKNDSDQIRLYSSEFEAITEFNSLELPQKKQGLWSDYVLGVMLLLKESGVPITGFDMLFTSTLPRGSGLSSSAALEVLVYYTLSKLFGKGEPDRTKMALDCQQIENRFIGVNCGIMDQFAVANGKEDHLMKLNCNTLDFDYVPIAIRNFSLLIVNSNKPRELNESAYNKRIAECDIALQELKARNTALIHLVDASLTDLEIIEDKVIQKRAKHAITEEKRVRESTVALAQNNLSEFGRLMNESHWSLSKDFEVSSSELDWISKFLQEQDGCLGARMTGAGFGGCCIALVETNRIEPIKDSLCSVYSKQFRLAPSFYSCKPSQGVRLLMND